MSRGNFSPPHRSEEEDSCRLSALRYIPEHSRLHHTEDPFCAGMGRNVWSAVQFVNFALHCLSYHGFTVHSLVFSMVTEFNKVEVTATCNAGQIMSLNYRAKTAA